VTLTLLFRAKTMVTAGFVPDLIKICHLMTLDFLTTVIRVRTTSNDLSSRQNTFFATLRP